MEISALVDCKSCLSAQIAQGFQGPVKAVEGEATQSVGNQEEGVVPQHIRNAGYHFRGLARRQSLCIQRRRYSFWRSVPGGHNVISGLFDGVKSLIQRTSSAVSSSVLAVWLTTSTSRLHQSSWISIATLVVSTSSVRVVQNSRRKKQFEKGIEILFASLASRPRYHRW